MKDQTHPAPWMCEMLKANTKLDKNGRAIVSPYPPELIMMSMLLQANGVPSSQVNENIITVLAATGKLDADLYNFPNQVTHRRWRFGMTYVCQVQIGMQLTQAANNKQQVATDHSCSLAHTHSLTHSRTLSHTLTLTFTQFG